MQNVKIQTKNVPKKRKERAPNSVLPYRVEPCRAVPYRSVLLLLLLLLPTQLLLYATAHSTYATPPPYAQTQVHPYTYYC